MNNNECRFCETKFKQKEDAIIHSTKCLRLEEQLRDIRNYSNNITTNIYYIGGKALIKVSEEIEGEIKWSKEIVIDFQDPQLPILAKNNPNFLVTQIGKLIQKIEENSSTIIGEVVKETEMGWDYYTINGIDINEIFEKFKDKKVEIKVID